MRPRARKRVMDYVRQHPGALVSRIARDLGMSRPAVRYHLAVLRADGRVVLVASARQGQKGRPGLRYSLSQRLAGENVAMLASALLDVTRTILRNPEGTVMPALAKALVERLSDPPIEDTGRGRLATLVSRLSGLHYEAHWEAGALGPRLIFGNCPYASVIARHPALCDMDRRAISQLVGVEARQEAKIDPEGQRPSRCIFGLDWSPIESNSEPSMPPLG